MVRRTTEREECFLRINDYYSTASSFRSVHRKLKTFSLLFYRMTLPISEIHRRWDCSSIKNINQSINLCLLICLDFVCWPMMNKEDFAGKVVKVENSILPSIINFILAEARFPQCTRPSCYSISSQQINPICNVRFLRGP